MVDLLTYWFDCKIQSFLVQLLHIRSLDNLEQKKWNKYFVLCTTSILNTTVVTINRKVPKTLLRKSTIKSHKKLKINLTKITESSVERMIKKHKKTGNKTRGPRATGRSPEWHCHCRYADVMQHLSNPVIATNEKIIILVLNFEEEYI